MVNPIPTDPLNTTNKILLGLAVGSIVILAIASIYLVRKLRREKAKRAKAKEIRNYLFREGNVNQLNTELTADEQAELLPYDKSFEVHRDKIALGRSLNRDKRSGITLSRSIDHVTEG